MTEAPTTQLVSVSFGLAGQQYARITVTHAGTRQAEMSLLWGSLLLTLTTEAQVENLKLAWFSAVPLVRALPANLGSLAVLSGIDPGMQQPGVVLRMHGEAAHWTVEHLPARYAQRRRVAHEHVMIRFGRLGWQVFDRRAHHDTMSILKRISKLSPAAFGD